MALDHSRLIVYRTALNLLAVLDDIIEQLPPGRAHLKDQLDRAGTSIVLKYRRRRRRVHSAREGTLLSHCAALGHGVVRNVGRHRTTSAGISRQPCLRTALARRDCLHAGAFDR
jgi:hypothetical protein